MIEVEVHQSLLNFLRSQNQPHWPHNLTMARLVARALRLGRSALIQTASPPGSRNQQYQLSYLLPVLIVLMSDGRYSLSIVGSGTAGSSRSALTTCMTP